MKRYFFSGKDSKFLRLTIFLCFVSIYSYGTNITIAPYLIQFNFNTASYSDDALTVRNEIGESITEPEWAPDEGRNEPAAYIKNQDSIKIRVWFESNYSGSVHLIVKLSVSAGNGIGTVCNLFIPNYVTNSDFVDIQLSGNLPNYVGKHTFTWNWEIYAIPVSLSSYCAAWDTTSTTHTYYTVLAAPQEPMAQPWTIVLDYACDWAEGLQEEEPCVYWITNKANTDLGKVYWANGTHTYDDELFDLSDFLNEGWADCRDMSAVVQIFSNAIGVQNIYVRKILSFKYKPIIPIGTSVPVTGEWVFHQVGYFNNVYDACLMLTIPNNHVPTNEDINNEYRSSLRDDGAWTVQDTFRYIEVE